MNLGTATVIRGNARCLPLADNSVDLVVTSPPYFALRSYQDNGEHYAGQIGDEPTPTEFIDALIEVTAECMRVLKPTGSLFVNLGDKYALNNRGSGYARERGVDDAKSVVDRTQIQRTYTMREKSLIGIPWRYALRCIDDLGLILRAEVILDKKNGLPESVTDRVRRSHEQVFHFVKEPQYFSAVDEIRERYDAPRPGGVANGTPRIAAARQTTNVDYGGERPEQNPLGKLPGSVWPYTSEPFQPPAHLGVDHFAAYATALPRQIILGWSPSGVCTGCGQGRRPLVRKDLTAVRTAQANNAPRQDVHRYKRHEANGHNSDHWQPMTTTATISSYACDCAEPTAATTPAVILDPFGGTGTTALVAKALGRHGITVDMSADYGRLAKWRVNDLDQLAKVQGIRRSDAARAADGLDMDTLFDFDGGGAA